MGKYFGTDGVRGVAGADLTCEMAMLGRGVSTPMSRVSKRSRAVGLSSQTPRATASSTSVFRMLSRSA